MGDALSGVRLTETVVAALRLGSARRPTGEPLDSQTLLLALAAVDSIGDWGRLLVDDRRKPDPDSVGPDTWDGVPLTGTCAAALMRTRQIADAYDLLPVPPGALALALAWDVNSGASSSFVGLDHDEMLDQIQDDILGTRLNGMRDLLSAGRPPLSREQGLDEQPAMSVADFTGSLAAVTSPFRLGVLRTVVALALVGIYLAFATSPEWSFQAVDDLAPPIDRPAIAEAIPATSDVAETIGAELVREQDGLPRLRIFDSMSSTAYDLRHEVVAGAWAGEWVASDGKTAVRIELAGSKIAGFRVLGVDDCQPHDLYPVATVESRVGYEKHGDTFAAFCSLSSVRQTQVYVGVLTSDPLVLDGLPDRVATLRSLAEERVPAPTFSVQSHFKTPYATAVFRRSLLGIVVALPLLWSLSTLLLDRATWQRIMWTLTLRRFRSLSLPGVDIDDHVRGRLWSSLAVVTIQVMVALWLLKLTWSWGSIESAGVVLAGVLAVSAVPRATHLHRVGRTKTFAGRRRILWVIGTLLGLSAVGFAMIVAFFSIVLTTLGTSAGPDYAQERFALLLRFAAIPIALLAVVPTMLMRRIAMRGLRAADVDDGTPPILLLRSFADDGIRLRARGSQRRSLIDRLSLRRWERFEEVIASALAVQGPVYGVGQVGERLPPPLGAVRRQFSNEEWQDRVRELMGEASIICVTLGRSSALAWEIRRIAEFGYLTKTIFVLPPTSRREQTKRLAVLAELLELDWVDLDVRLSGGRALVVRVDGVGRQPLVITARAQEDVAYDIAMEFARLTILGWRWEVPSLSDQVTLEAPRAQIHPPGKAPVVKSVFRRPGLLLVLVNLSGIVSLPFVFLAGEDEGTSQTITLPESAHPWAVAADASGSGTYTILNGRSLCRLDFEDGSAHLVTEIDPATSLIVDGDWAVAANSAAGTLQGVDVDRAAVAWKVDEREGVRALVRRGDIVYYVLPKRREVVAADLETGRTTATTKVSGVPWATTVYDDTIAVALVDSDEVLELDPVDLSVRARHAVAAGPRAIVAANKTLWAYSVRQHALKAVDGEAEGATIHTRSEYPHFASNGSVLAIEGVEMLSTLRPDGRMHRNRFFWRHADDLAIAGDGDVLALNGNHLELVRTSRE